MVHVSGTRLNHFEVNLHFNVKLDYFRGKKLVLTYRTFVVGGVIGYPYLLWEGWSCNQSYIVTGMVVWLPSYVEARNGRTTLLASLSII